MKRTLKVLSALLSYPTESMQAAVPEMRAALDADGLLPRKSRDRLDRVIDEIAGGDIYDLQERYVLLFDRTRSLSLHLFEHVHGESRDRGQAMVDLKSLYERHGLAMSSSDLPDYLPLFLEFLSEIPEAEARDLIEDTAHILEAIRLRLKRRKVAYSSIFSCLKELAQLPSQPQVEAALAAETDENPEDLEALDAVWAEEEVRFSGASDPAACGKDGLAARLRAGARPAPGIERPAPRRPVVTHRQSNRA
ncbi:MAG: nitrate reductase molybdenum cofactor assembly chaperone [Hyphomicrobiaceae bacterium]|nr:MAG: nitrate reductase molybdenum cofactor assembly chaperone [Hyphomicrobiaceae bacterium]